MRSYAQKINRKQLKIIHKHKSKSQKLFRKRNISRIASYDLIVIYVRKYFYNYEICLNTGQGTWEKEELSKRESNPMTHMRNDYIRLIRGQCT